MGDRETIIVQQPTETVVAKVNEDGGNIYTWMYVALVIIIIIAGYNIWWNWQYSATQEVMSGGQVLAWAGNLILFFGSIIAIFAVYNRSISCQAKGTFSFLNSGQTWGTVKSSKATMKKKIY